MAVKSIPDAYRTAKPYFIVNDGVSSIAFYIKAFGAIELMRLAEPRGKVMHAELRIDHAPVMLAEEFPDMGYRSPQSLGGSPVSIRSTSKMWIRNFGRRSRLGRRRSCRCRTSLTAIAAAR